MCLGIPGKVIDIIDEENCIGVVDVSGVQRQVNLSCVAEPGETLQQCLNQWVLVHVGFAMSRIDEAEAQATLKVLEELGEIQEELAAMQATAG